MLKITKMNAYYSVFSRVYDSPLYVSKIFNDNSQIRKIFALYIKPVMKNYYLSCEITKRKETSINKLTFMELEIVSKDSHASTSPFPP